MLRFEILEIKKANDFYPIVWIDSDMMVTAKCVQDQREVSVTVSEKWIEDEVYIKELLIKKHDSDIEEEKALEKWKNRTPTNVKVGNVI